jgi:hypothetical protein
MSGHCHVEKCPKMCLKESSGTLLFRRHYHSCCHRLRVVVFIIIIVVVRRRYHCCRHSESVVIVPETLSFCHCHSQESGCDLCVLTLRSNIFLMHCSFRGPNKIVALDLTSVVVVARRVVVSSVLTSTLTPFISSGLHTFISFLFDVVSVSSSSSSSSRPS